MQKNQTTAPMFAKNLGASPQKPDKSAIDKGKLAQSKVYIKRHQLYSELDHIPVTVEQSSCFQILEDFLRNRVKTMEQVKGLRFDYGFGGHGPPGGMGREQSTLTQKIMRKSLSKPAQKLLDSANDRLVKILNNSDAYRVRARPPPKKKVLEQEDSGEDMEGIESKNKEESEEKHSEGSNSELKEDDPFKEEMDRSKSEGSGEMDEDPEAEEEEMQAEIERQK